MWVRGWDADAKTVHTWDGVVVLWVVIWLVVGAWTGYEIWQLTSLSGSTEDAGRALQSAGSALQGLSDAPIIGDRTSAIGDRVVATATSIVDSGIRAGTSIRSLSVLIGLTVAVAPSGPVLLFYVPARIGRARELRQ